jgi:hypothetical protein
MSSYGLLLANQEARTQYNTPDKMTMVLNPLYKFLIPTEIEGNILLEDY